MSYIHTEDTDYRVTEAMQYDPLLPMITACKHKTQTHTHKTYNV
jgi:hypothetical protein